MTPMPCRLVAHTKVLRRAYGTAPSCCLTATTRLLYTRDRAVSCAYHFCVCRLYFSLFEHSPHGCLASAMERHLEPGFCGAAGAGATRTRTTRQDCSSVFACGHTQCEQHHIPRRHHVFARPRRYAPCHGAGVGLRRVCDDTGR